MQQCSCGMMWGSDDDFAADDNKNPKKNVYYILEYPLEDCRSEDFT
jgi:hypothetical protein